MMDRQPSRDQVRSLVSDHLSEQYTRRRSEADVSTELDRLHNLLVHAAQAYETGPVKQRQAVCDAVIAISDFLKGQGFSGATLMPMNRVISAIVDLCDQNRPDALFCEKAKKSKPRRSMEDAVRQGQLAALADAWLKAHASDHGDETAKLGQAARRMTGAYFGKLYVALLRSARSYQRQPDHQELLYRAYQQMDDVLNAEAKAAGGGPDGLRLALELQIDALNAKAELRQS